MVGDMLGGSVPSQVSYNPASLSYNVSGSDEQSINQPGQLSLNIYLKKAKEKNSLGFSVEQSLLLMICIVKFKSKSIATLSLKPLSMKVWE